MFRAELEHPFETRNTSASGPHNIPTYHNSLAHVARVEREDDSLRWGDYVAVENSRESLESS